MAIVGIAAVTWSKTLLQLFLEERCRQVLIERDQAPAARRGAHKWMINYQEIVLFGQLFDRLFAKCRQRARPPVKPNLRVSLGKASGRRQQRSQSARMIPSDAFQLN